MWNVLATNITTFIEDELIEYGMGHIKSLYIIVECKDMIVARVLVDNSLALNICSMIN